jgi:2-polyprenyl-6-methoxyphenol hydroxylase-like FAD-dependent oxidoreductase
MKPSDVPAPKAPQRLGKRALVLGGSLAGLFSAGVLARHFDQVLIVERDDVTRRANGSRRGVPQGRHSHGLLVGGSQAMERLLPGLKQDLVFKGAIETDVVSGIRWCFGGVEQARFDSDLQALLASRPLIEEEVRRHVLGLAGVVLLGGHDIAGLVVSGDQRRILGARVEPNGSAPTPDPTAGQFVQDGSVLADLIVDATGVGSRAATWLRELGYPAVEESLVEAGLTYVTRRFRQQPGVLEGLDGDVVGSDPQGARSGVALRQEDGIWTVTLAGAFGERPPGELAEFQAFARTLPTCGLAEVAQGCEPLGEPLTYRYPASRWLHWEKTADRPERFTVIGDAVCSFNPVYGQGMSSAALQAEALGTVLVQLSELTPAQALAELPGRAAEAFAQVIETPWALATGPDRRHSSQPAKPWIERVLDRYFDRLIAVAPADRELTLAFTRVLNLLAPAPTLFSPRIALRVLRPGAGRRTARPAGPRRPRATLSGRL